MGFASIMADKLTDAELVAELRSLGETAKIKLPLTAVKRGVLTKKLNHLRVKSDKKPSETFKRPLAVSRPRSIASFSSDESDIGDPEINDRPSNRKKNLHPPSKRSSTRFSNVTDKNSPIGRASLNSVKGSKTSDVESASSSQTGRRRAPVSPGSGPPSPISPETAASTSGIGLGNLGRSIFPNWNRNHNSRPVDFDSSDSDVDGGSTCEVESRAVNTTSTLDEDENNSTNERLSLLNLPRKLSKRSSNRYSTDNLLNDQQNSPPRTSTPVRRTWQKDSPSANNISPGLNQQNCSPSIIRQQLNSSKGNHVNPEKIAEERKLQYVFKSGEVATKFNYTQHISMVLLFVAGLFFIVLSVLYISMRTEMPVEESKADNNLLICTRYDEAEMKSKNETKEKMCFQEDDALTAFKAISPLYDELSQRNGDRLCEKSLVGNMTRTELTNFLSDNLKVKKGWMYTDVVISLLIHNPHWHMKAMKADDVQARDLSEAKEVLYVESTVPVMSLMCRIMRAVKLVTTQLLLAFALIIFLVIAGCVTLYFVHYRVKGQEEQQKLVYDMVEKIIDVLKINAEVCQDEEEGKPYLAIQHVRDTLIPPANRKPLQSVWDKAVRFVESHESRVRVETQTIHGEDFTVWRWLQNCQKGQKVWQGQAFGEDRLNHVAKSPSPCIKVSNMFNADKENEDNWDVSVKDAILEKCSDCKIVHLHVDRGSNEGVVYAKCVDDGHAGGAFKQLHGWWFDGKLVTVKYLKVEHYSRSFPQSINAVEPLKPTTDRKLSLSQPFHRSSLEMT